ncbi:MAG: hypothetical protein Q4D98_10790 [Planctomycetia bacterium]|nr:hypothetical protein [Planctomycetia bacterium]
MKIRFCECILILVIGSVGLLWGDTTTYWIGGDANWTAAGWSNGDPSATQNLDAYLSSGTVTLTGGKTLTNSNLTMSGGVIVSSGQPLVFQGTVAEARPTFTFTGGTISLSQLNAWLGSVANNVAGINFVMTGGILQTTDPSVDDCGLTLRGNDVASISGGTVAVNRIHVGAFAYSEMTLSGGSVTTKNLDFGWSGVGGDWNVTGGTLCVGTLDFHGRSGSFLNISGGEVYVNTVQNIPLPTSATDPASTYLTGGTLSVGNYSNTLRNMGGTVEINTLHTITAETTEPVASKYGTMTVTTYAQRGGTHCVRHLRRCQ